MFSDLTSATLSDCNFTGTSFQHAMLTNAVLGGKLDINSIQNETRDATGAVFSCFERRPEN